MAKYTPGYRALMIVLSIVALTIPTYYFVLYPPIDFDTKAERMTRRIIDIYEYTNNKHNNNILTHIDITDELIDLVNSDQEKGINPNPWGKKTAVEVDEDNILIIVDGVTKEDCIDLIKTIAKMKPYYKINNKYQNEILNQMYVQTYNNINILQYNCEMNEKLRLIIKK